MARYCNICKGELVETDELGTKEECELCGTVYTIKPMGKEDESTK